MRLAASSFVLAAAALLAAFPPAAQAEPPETVLIQGQLLDDLGAPIVGLRQYRVRFYDAETEGAQLGGDISNFTQVNPQGLFAIALIPPAAVLNAPAAWYELALDSATPAVGVGPEDVFPERVRVHSVPFARMAGQALSIEVDAIGGGALSVEEFESLAGVTGSVQSQLDAKADAAAVDDALALKADQAAVNDALDAKPDLAEVLPRAGEAFVVVETTEDPVQNAANLQAAYAEAAALTPHGHPLEEDNRAVVIVPPGRYDLGTGSLSMDTEFVDVVGSTTSRDNHHLFGTSGGFGTGVLRQTADDVRIENLVVHCTRADGGFSGDETDPAAYFPDSDRPNTVVRNSRFLADDSNARSMRTHITYSGTYKDISSGRRAFGGFGEASGTFINCTGSSQSFGGGSGGIASGTFTHCTGGGSSFGGNGGEASGTFTNCTGGARSFGGGDGVASGTFTNCTGRDLAFGGGRGVASGTFIDCTGGSESFGGGNGGIASGTFTLCTGGAESFGGFGEATGTFTDCTGGIYSFGGGGGMASGTFTHCTGGIQAFGGGVGGTAPDGEFYYCVGRTNAFTTTGDPAPVHLYGVRNGAAFP